MVVADGGGWGFIFCQRAKRPPFPLTEMHQTTKKKKGALRPGQKSRERGGGGTGLIPNRADTNRERNKAKSLNRIGGWEFETTLYLMPY